MKRKEMNNPLVGITLKNGVITLSMFELDKEVLSNSVYTDVSLEKSDAESLYNKLGVLLNKDVKNPSEGDAKTDVKTSNKDVKTDVKTLFKKDQLNDKTDPAVSFLNKVLDIFSTENFPLGYGGGVVITDKDMNSIFGRKEKK